MAGWNQALTQTKNFWASRNQSQRIFLGAGAAVIVALLTFFTQMMSTPDYKPLMTGLEASDAQTISTELTAKKIPFQLSPDGKSINVPADQIDAARVEVASNQSTHSGRMGFEIFDKVSWGQTEFDEKVNYQRALEGELERTITTLGGVKSARVHLVMASDSVFLDRERGAKASVTLRLTRGELSREQRQAIQRLVAGAVDGLKLSDVSIIDADSNQVLGGPSETSPGGDEAEQQLTRRLVAALAPVVGADHLRASVNVEYDPGTVEESQEKYDPAVSVPLTVQRSDEQSGPGAGVGGVPGTASNVPQQKPNVPPPSGADANQTSKTENSTFGVNKVTRRSAEPAGRVRRITAALLVDDLLTRKQGAAKGKWVETHVKRSPEDLKQIETFAAAAIGIDPSRGDVLSVQNMSFDHPDPVEVPPVSMIDRTRKGLSDFAPVLRYAMLFVLFALAYVLMIRPIQKRALGEGASVPLLDDLAAAFSLPTSVATQPHTEDDLTRALALKEQLVLQVKAEPTNSARAVQAWLRGEAE